MVKHDTGPIYFDPDALCPGGAIVFRTYTYSPDNEYGNYVELITPENYIFRTVFRLTFRTLMAQPVIILRTYMYIP